MPRPKKSKDGDSAFEGDLVLKSIEDLGANVMTSLDDLKYDHCVSTGIWGFDWALGGGIPNISVVEVHGPNTVGKTSVALHMANQAASAGMTVYYVDMEYAVNDKQAEIFIKNPDKVKWIQPESGEKALEIIKLILKTTKNSFIVLDSVGASVPEKIAEGSVGDSHVGVQARMFMQFGPTAKVWTRKNGNILLAINQESSKITPSGRPGISLAGGRKWEYVPDFRIRFTKRFQNGDIKEGDEQIGHVIEAKITKNRFGAPFRTADLPLIYGLGFDVYRELLENAVNFGVVKKAGAWYSVGEEGKEYEPAKCQGLSAMSLHISRNELMLADIKDQLTEMVS